MPKRKTYQDLLQRRLRRTFYYRWQFLRLNQKYRESYNWYIDYRKKIPTESQKEDFDKEFAQELFVDYGINGIHDYRKTSLPAHLRIEGEDPPAQRGTIQNVFEGRCHKDQRIAEHFLIERINLYDKKLKREVPHLSEKYVNVVINCDFNLEDIFKDITLIYHRTRDVRRRRLGVVRISTLEKADIKELKTCIKVFNLRKKDNKWARIAKIIYPIASHNSSIERVRKNFDKACSLIDGGYRKIVV